MSLLPLVQCPPIPKEHTLREQASPSALQTYAACRRSWGYRYLEGRRETSLTWAEARALPEPPKPKRGASALEKATAEAERKAWNKLRRPALGTEVHARLQAYMTQGASALGDGRVVDGAWHPPLAWVELDWHDEPGRIAAPAVDVLPDPRSLVAVHTELAAECEAPASWYGQGQTHPVMRDENGDQICCEDERVHWPRMPGFYDLITVELGGDGRGDGSTYWYIYRLWDYKSTSSFDWAKTTDELREDPQVLLYALDAMQKYGLQEIECNWVYLLTDPEKRPRAYVVTIVVTRAEAEAAVLEMAETAARVVDTVRLFAGGKLRVVDLEQDTSACTAYGGCVYQISRGGPCDPGRVSPGKAMAQRAKLDEKIRARKSARKVAEISPMALSFAERKAQRDAAKAAGAASGGAAEASAEAAETEAPAAAPTDTIPAPPPKAKAAPAAKAKGSVIPGEIGATVDGYSFAVPAGTALGKALAKAAAAHKSLYATFEGE